MHLSTVITCVALLSSTGWARYTLQDDYFSGGSFFDNFDFFSGADPTEGTVLYNGRDDSLITTDSASKAQWGVSTQQSTPGGRPSIRITSKKSYQSGLVVLDLEHMPGSICGAWPAFWMVGPDWPNQGEIDIIEGVNDQRTNAMTLHTGAQCSISQSKFTGSITHTNCDVSNGDNTGCQITAPNDNTYGDGLNSNGGGVYATEWTGNSISIWFFPRGSTPSDLESGSPDPSSWGSPLANFQGGCDISSAFTNQQIVFDTTFCGQWAGDVWSGSTCAASTGASTCEAYVQNNGAAFKDAYWTINSLKVYQGGSSGSGGQPSAAPHPSASATRQPHGHSTMATVPSSPASGSQPAGSPPAWPQPSAPSQAPPPSQAPAPSVPSAQSGSAPANPTPSWGGSGQPWGEQPNSSGGWNVGQPAFQTKHHHGANKAQQTDTANVNANNNSNSGSTAGLHEDNGAYDVSIPTGEERVRRHLRHHRSRHGARRL